MHIAFKVGMQDYASHLNRSFHPEEIDHYLNEAIEYFIDSRFDKPANYKQEGFEESFKRIEDLRSLIKTNEELECRYDSENVLNGFDFDHAELPSDWLYPISFRAIVKSAPFTVIDFAIGSDQRVSDEDPSTVLVKWVQQDDIYRLLDDPFNTTEKEHPLATIKGDQIHIFTNDSFITHKVIVNYLKKPNVVSIGSNTNCDLASSTHREIINRAVLIAKGEGGQLGSQVEYQILTKDE